MDNKTETLNVDYMKPEKSELCSKDSVNENKFLEPILQENVSLRIPNQSRILIKDSTDTDNFYLKLGKLNISNYNLPALPEVVLKNKYLTDLNLSNNELEYVPIEIKNLQNLLSLNLSGNKLSSLPEFLQHNHQLVYLNISHNNFSVVPDVLYCGLRMIEILDMSSNEIANFSEPPKCLNNLLELRLNDNKLEKVPKWIFNSPCQLQILELAGNELKGEPMINYYNSKIFQTLRVLNIGNCNFRQGSIQFLCHFKNIEILDLGNKEYENKKSQNNYIGALEIDVFKNFMKLKKLSLNYVGLGIFPSGLYSFTNIEFMDLSNNSLSWLPESFCDLISLKILDLTSNQLLFLPNNIGDLVNLQEIYLGKNQLIELPKSLNALNNLEFIDLYGNKIEIIDKNIILQKKLIGIDLGNNCLDISLDVENKSDNVWKRYDELKVSYREHFGLVNNRSDVQTKVDNTDEIIYDYSDGNNSISDNDSVSSFKEPSNTVITHCMPKEEIWEELSDPEVEKDDLFDPNVNRSVSNPSSLYSAFERNYCPAYSNAQSLRLTFRGSHVLNNVIEGQFDSD